MYIPASTYRIQFNNRFTFKNLEKILEFLKSLGIGAVYASPVFEAVPGSTHGYDVTNPLNFNPEIGTNEQFDSITQTLRLAGIGWIQDIVPNHMAFHPGNPWLMDVLEKGKLSAYSGYFDIDWNHPEFQNKLIVPILGKSCEQAVNDGEIQLKWENGGLLIRYYDFTLPVSGESFHELLEQNKVLEGSYFVGQGIANDEFKSDRAFHGFGWSNSRERFQAIYETDNSFESMIDEMCARINTNSQEMLELLSGQHYVLTHWQEAEKRLNYRRFFTINGLISLSMDKPKVFEDYHAFIHENVAAGKFQGLRIDHIDGLKCPQLYFEMLRSKMGEDTFIVAEKILSHDEELHTDWPVQGTSGYDFLAIVNNLFTYKNGVGPLNSFYNDYIGNKESAYDTIYEKKKAILNQSFRGDWDNISRYLHTSGIILYNEKVTPENMHDALGEFLVNFPVYKVYSDQLPPEPEDAVIIRETIDRCVLKTPHLQVPLTKLGEIFLNNSSENDHYKKCALELFLRCMQYTGPLMAKGVEDTAMYTWSAFIAHNEVGDAINASGISTGDFHRLMIDRQNNYPLSVNATATHDTKRGEDTRARLQVISDLYPEWTLLVKTWINNSLAQKTTVNDDPAPDINEEYFVYQTLVGALQMNGEADSELPERLKNYFQKALREAKIHSGWNTPNEAYETAIVNFAVRIIEKENNIFPELQRFVKKIIPWGIINSLSQLVLKSTCPGVPDFYQGTEFWDLSLVDPDNRRWVDYSRRNEMLEILKHKFQQQKNFLSELMESRENGNIKLWLTHKLMRERANNKNFFVTAGYLPLTVTGKFKEHVLAFARNNKKLWYVTVVPLHPVLLNRIGKKTDWGDTCIELPENAPKNWELIWDNSRLSTGNLLPLKKALPSDCPSVFRGEAEDTGRGSGILLHITSLPGKYGCGDLGREAYRFVDLLKQSKQSYWQVLPFNPVGGSYSPYSSHSAFAGNTTLIDPDDLYKRHLIDKLPLAVTENNFSNFPVAEKIRETIIEEAFESYVQNRSVLLQKRFENFCHQENYWLDDFALFSILKQEFDNQPWNTWPIKVKTREAETISVYREKFASALTKIKFGQYLFSEQFRRLKQYANKSRIGIIGDMPIYVSYDSSDVWSHPHLFRLDPLMQMEAVAGVPPDYFSETGQLWNMPLYNWQKMEAENYTWWIQRIQKNLEYCDILRFDHFRGFSSYWEVPAGEKTAVNGSWIHGPAHNFFDTLNSKFPEMPFIAEDLGEIDENVYKLRDDFKLPGMKVLQFAFGDNMPYSVHIPHLHTVNSIVYTGTHDNNTLKGWYRNEADKHIKSRIKEYLNRKINADNITKEFLRVAFGSVAKTVIVPFQDVLNLDERARFNNPSIPEGNWTWKLKSEALVPENFSQMKYLTELYGR